MVIVIGAASSGVVQSNYPVSSVAPSVEGGGEEGGGEEPAKGPANVSAEIFAERLRAPGWMAIWSCLTPGSHNGYRVRMQAIEGADWEVRLEKFEAGVETLLASAPLLEVAEEFAELALTVEAGVLTVTWGGATVITHADGTYTEGRAGMEGLLNTDFGLRHFKQGGVELDDLLREEDPLAKPKWTRLPFVADTGECFDATFGWVPTATLESGTTSGAYWK